MNKPYRLVYDNTAGWILQRQDQKGDWSPHRYPGRDLNRVAHTLINEELDGEVVVNYEDWVAVYEAAAKRVEESLKRILGGES